MSVNDMIELMTHSGKMNPNIELLEETAAEPDEEDED